MKELKFFYDEIESGGISKRVEEYKSKVLGIQNDPRYVSRFPYKDLLYDDDYTKYSYFLYIPGAPKLYKNQSEYSPNSFDLQLELHKKFEAWFDESYNNCLFELAEDLRKVFIKKIKKYIILIEEDELLTKVIKPSLDSFLNKMVDLYPVQFKTTDFKVTKKGTHKTTYLPDSALADLQRVYNFENATITDDINEENWTLYFIGKIQLSKNVRLKISNELISLMLDRMAKKHLKYGYYGHFYKTIEADNRIITIDGTPLSESNIKKSASDVIRFRFKDKSKSQLLDRINQCISE